MKRLVIIIVLLFTGVINAQWTQVTNWNGNQFLKDCYFVDSLNGWAVGNGHPSIYHTTDGGLTWASQVEPGTEMTDYNKVQFLNDKIGYVVGSPNSDINGFGTFLKTTNAGQTWFKLNNPVRGAARGMYWLDSLNGWACGATTRLYYYGDTTGTNSGIIWRTTDGGTTWSIQYLDKPKYGFRHIQILSNGLGWLGGTNNLYTTTDFGTTWTKNSLVIPAGFDYITGLKLLNNHIGYFASMNTNDTKMIIYKTDDFGQTWQQPIQINYEGLFFCQDSLNLYCLVSNYLNQNDFGQYILRSTDAGLTWSKTKLIEFGTVYQGIFALGNNAWVVGPQIWRYSKPVLPPMFISVSYPRTLYWPVEFKVTMEINDFDDHQLSAVKLIDCTPDSLRVYGSYPNYEIRGSVPESLVGQSFQFCVLAIGFSGDSTIYLSDSIKVDRLTKVEELPGMPTEYTLNQNYPNPFNPSTKIRYSIPTSGNVNLTIYNIIGQQVATLVNEYQSVGNYEYTFTADNLASGTYIYRLVAGNYVSTKKMVYVK